MHLGADPLPLLQNAIRARGDRIIPRASPKIRCYQSVRTMSLTPPYAHDVQVRAQRLDFLREIRPRTAPNNRYFWLRSIVRQGGLRQNVA